MSTDGTKPTITDTTYKRGSAANLVDYIEHDGTLRNRAGLEMDDWERNQLIQRSKQEQFERHVVVSPHNADQLDTDEIGHAVRETINDQFDGSTVDYAYSVHTDGGDRPHAHVVLVGDEQDLYMDREDCDALRERATDACQERQHTHEHTRHMARDQDRDRQDHGRAPGQRWLDEDDYSDGWRQ